MYFECTRAQKSSKYNTHNTAKPTLGIEDWNTVSTTCNQSPITKPIFHRLRSTDEEFPRETAMRDDRWTIVLMLEPANNQIESLFYNIL